MKIAICISGHLRNCHLYIDNFKEKILDVLSENNIEYDIYLLTYSNIITTKKFSKEKSLPVNNDISVETDASLKILLKKIKIKKYLVKEQVDETVPKFIDFDYICIKKKNGITRIVDDFPIKDEVRHRGLCQFKHRNECFNLIDNIDDYNYIIWRRPDIYYFDKFDIKLMTDNDLTFPNNHRFGGTQVHFTTVIGKPEIMKEVMLLYDHVKNDNYELVNKFNEFYKTKNFFPNLLPVFFLCNIKNYKIYFNSFRDTITRVVDNEIIFEDRKDWNEFPEFNIIPEFDLSICKSKNN